MQRWRWVLGLYYLHADDDYMHGARVLDNGPLLLPPGTLAADYPTQVFQTTDNYSIFGQAEYDFTDTLTLVAGLRVMREKKDYDYALQVRGLPPDPRDEFIGPFIGVFSDIVGLPVSTETHQSSSDPLWAGKLQLDWRPNDKLLVYAGVNRGVKAGGFNNPVDFGATQLQPGFRYPYDPEELLSYEAGFKTTLFNDTTRLNGSIYYYDYHNYQGFFYHGLSSTIVNYDATTLGGELELATTPLKGLDLMLSLSLIDAKVKDVEVATDITEDTEPAFTPPVQFSASARYTWPMLGGQVAVQGDATYTDRFFYSIQNFTSHRLDSYWLADARLSWTSADNKWEVAGTVNNLTDEEYATHGFGVSLFCGCSEVGVGRPRWFGFEVKRNFNYKE